MRRTPWAGALGLAATSLLLALPATAADYFVNDASLAGDVAFSVCATMGAGADAPACGTCASPCRSPQYAYDQLPLTAGDTVWMNTGRYTVTGANPILDLDDPTKAGTPTSFLTFRGPSDTRGKAAVDVNDTPLALFDGQGTASAGVVLRVNGIRLQSFGVTSVRNYSCDKALLCGGFVRIASTSLVSSFEVLGLNLYGLTDAFQNAIDINQDDTACTRCLIEGNEIHSSPSALQAIYVAGLQGVELRKNLIRNVGSANDAVAIVLYGTTNAQVVNNVIRNCAGDGGVVAGPDEEGLGDADGLARELSLGCGCQGGAGPWGLLWAGLWLAATSARRRRRWAGGAGHPTG